MKPNLPPFDIFNQTQYWVGHTIPYEITFSIGLKGVLHRDIFKQALKHVLLETPQLQTRLRDVFDCTKRIYKKTKKNFNVDTLLTYSKLEVAIHQTRKTHEFDEVAQVFINSNINLYKSIPLRIHLSEHSNTHTIIYIKTSHSLTDGFGCMLILSRIFQKYNNIINKPNKLTLPDEPENYSMEQLKKHVTDDSVMQKIGETLQYPASYFKDSATINGIVKNIYSVIPHETFNKLKKISKEASYTLNEIINAVAVKTTQKLVTEYGVNKRYLRLIQTINVRKDANMAGGITNFSSIFSSIIKEEETSDIKNTIETIKTQTDYALKNKTYLYPLFAESAPKRIPTKKYMRMKKEYEQKIGIHNPLFSTVMSNLSTVDSLIECPYDCSFEYLWAITPPDATVGSQWGVATLKNNFCINFVYIDPIIKDSTAEKAMKYFLNELDMTIKNL